MDDPRSSKWYHEYTDYIYRCCNDICNDKSINISPPLEIVFMERRNQGYIKVNYTSLKGQKSAKIYLPRKDDGT